jgi:hypothetical protein
MTTDAVSTPESDTQDVDIVQRSLLLFVFGVQHRSKSLLPLGIFRNSVMRW